MVVPLRPGKFYGSSLPRPRIYTDVKLSDERVDPPLSILDPLMSWAYDAHWSMGGLSFKRLRLQGKIEGNAQKLRKEREQTLKKKIENSTPISQSKNSLRNRVKKGGNRVDSPPPAPISKKRRQRMVMEDEEDDEEEIVMEKRKVARENVGLRRKRRRLVRKLGDDFESVASDNGKSGWSPLMDLSNEGVALRTRSRRSMVLIEEEEKEDDSGGKSSKAKKGGVENGESETIKEKNACVSPNGGKVSVSASASAIGSRSSPRLKQRTN